MVKYYDEAGERAIIISPETMIHVKKSNIRELQTPPQFRYGEKIIPQNHPAINGIVAGIYWHLNLIVFITESGLEIKLKRKRYSVQLTGIIEDVNYYDGSRPKIQYSCFS